ncbi:hypothetical protein ACOZ4I_17570 (plasmid) [Haloarcula salina]|uniref:hypothetical protein n=1 Tax=Haloarcula salina TaxID=1429914 RepID=UPI003C6F632D
MRSPLLTLSFFASISLGNYIGMWGLLVGDSDTMTGLDPQRPVCDDGIRYAEHVEVVKLPVDIDVEIEVVADR